MTVERQCKNCQFWTRLGPEDVSGQCRRFPPTVAQTPRQEESLEGTGAGPFTGVWPDTLGVDWCGEFQARELVPEDTAIAELQLSGRTRGCLEKADIDTVQDLISRSPAELLKIRNFGEASLREVQQKLSEKGLALRAT